jgi:HEAT repeat protein
MGLFEFFTAIFEIFDPDIRTMLFRNDINGLIKALSYRKSKVRENAAWALGKTGDERSVEHLIRVLNDSDVYVQYQAMESLIKIGESASEPLVKSLTHEDPVIRSNSAAVLGIIGSKETVEPLIEALNDRDVSV